MLVLCRLVIAKNFIWMTTSKILRLTSKKKSRIGFDLVDRGERRGPFANTNSLLYEFEFY